MGFVFLRNGWSMTRSIFIFLFILLTSPLCVASGGEQSEVQLALNENPDLKFWMAQGGEVADIAIGIDDKLSADPLWRDKSLSARFREVERLTKIIVNGDIPQVNFEKNKDSDSMKVFWDEQRKLFHQDSNHGNKTTQATISNQGAAFEKAVIGGLSAALIILTFGAYKSLKRGVMTMDSRKKTLNILLLAFILTSIIPPWKYAVDWGRAKKESPAGYSFILTPPTPTSNMNRTSVSIDFHRLLIQWAALGGVAALLFINRKPNDK